MELGLLTSALVGTFERGLLEILSTVFWHARMPSLWCSCWLSLRTSLSAKTLCVVAPKLSQSQHVTQGCHAMQVVELMELGPLTSARVGTPESSLSENLVTAFWHSRMPSFWCLCWLGLRTTAKTLCVVAPRLLKSQPVTRGCRAIQAVKLMKLGPLASALVGAPGSGLSEFLVATFGMQGCRVSGVRAG